VPPEPQSKSHYLRVALLALIIVAFYSKTLGLPLALALTTADSGGIARGSLLVLASGASPSDTRLLCYDDLATACLIREPGQTAASGSREYRVVAVVQPPVPLLLVGALVFASYRLAGGLGRPLLALVGIALLLNGVAVGLTYIDQGRITYSYTPPKIVSGPEVDLRSLVVTYSIAWEGEAILKCEAYDHVFEGVVSGGTLSIRIPRAVIEEAADKVPRPIPSGATTVKVSVDYECEGKLGNGTLRINDGFSFQVVPLVATASGNEIIVYNPNPLNFTAKIIIHYKDSSATVVEIAIGPFQEKRVQLPQDAASAYLTYDFFGRTISQRVWG